MCFHRPIPALDSVSTKRNLVVRRIRGLFSPSFEADCAVDRNSRTPRYGQMYGVGEEGEIPKEKSGVLDLNA